jgi:hypothetical protein
LRWGKSNTERGGEGERERDLCAVWPERVCVKRGGRRAAVSESGCVRCIWSACIWGPPDLVRLTSLGGAGRDLGEVDQAQARDFVQYSSR